MGSKNKHHFKIKQRFYSEKDMLTTRVKLKIFLHFHTNPNQFNRQAKQKTLQPLQESVSAQPRICTKPQFSDKIFSSFFFYYIVYTGWSGFYHPIPVRTRRNWIKVRVRITWRPCETKYSPLLFLSYRSYLGVRLNQGNYCRLIRLCLVALFFFFLFCSFFIIKNLRIILKIMFGNHFYFLFLKFNNKKLY